ncbi:hypothetical protein V2I01_31220 [Micromonospora sp. BRA006-A]|nr:hypothetical protein [Micromonospora sp. BRA006-A]
MSSFGVSGTNAHTIIEQAPAPAEVEAEVEPTAAGPHGGPVLLSARSDAALAAQAGRWAARFAADETLRPLDVAFSSVTSRSTLDRRAVLSATGRDDLLAAARARRREPAGTVVLGAGARAASSRCSSPARARSASVWAASCTPSSPSSPPPSTRRAGTWTGPCRAPA